MEKILYLEREVLLWELLEKESLKTGYVLSWVLFCCENLNGAIGFVCSFPGILLLTHGIVDMDEMFDPGATTGGSN